MDVHFSEYAFFRFRDNAAGSGEAGRLRFIRRWVNDGRR